MITLFGSPRRTTPEVTSPEHPRSEHEDASTTKRPRISEPNQDEAPDAAQSSSTGLEQQAKYETEPNLESGKKNQHGPKFQKLTAEQRQQLSRMHHNQMPLF